MFFLFFALLIFLFNSAILFSIHLEELRLELLFLGIILDSIDSNDFSDSFSFSIALATSLFIDLIFFLLNPTFVLWAALAILFSSSSIWDFKLSISFDKFLNFLFNLEFLFRHALVVSLLGLPLKAAELPIPVVGLVPLVVYLRLGEKLLTQLFSIENNLLIYALW